MSSRAHQKDTEADRELYACLNSVPPRSFTMIAGAGSGKTTSLIKGLTEILSKQGDRLKLRRQKVVCITYTEVAANEIRADVGNNPLVHVSTIHSFLWLVICSFKSDIKAWVEKRIDDKVLDLRDKASKFSNRVHTKTQQKNQRDIIRLDREREEIRTIYTFTYGIGSNYSKGILGHEDIINMVPQLILERALLRSLIAQQYPFFFIDESQDTTIKVVEALKAVQRQMATHFCLGFFGDPMQRIYPTGIGDVPSELDWASIEKPENFRCPSVVLSVANAIRRDGDGLVQRLGRVTGPGNFPTSYAGSANIFILPIYEDRDPWIRDIRKWIAQANNDPAWESDQGEEAVKLLVIVHRMAAKRLNFGELYAALNDRAPDEIKSGFLDGSSWPVRQCRQELTYMLG